MTTGKSQAHTVLITRTSSSSTLKGELLQAKVNKIEVNSGMQGRSTKDESGRYPCQGHETQFVTCRVSALPDAYCAEYSHSTSVNQTKGENTYRVNNDMYRSNGTRRSIPPFADSIIHIDLITEIIFSFCSPATILRTARTCHTARNAINAYIRRAFNINRHLLRFFSDPLAFRSLQACTGTLISGSNALQFFDRSFYPSSDLDLYVHIMHRREVGRWLINVGYTFVPAPYQDADFEMAAVESISSIPEGIYSMPGVAAVLTFTKPVQNDTELKVQLIVAQNTPMEVVLGFHSTCVMNVISYEKAYCLFPKATLEERRSLRSSSCLGHSKRRSEGLRKYAERGFQMLVHLPAHELAAARPSFRLGWRWIDDDASWVLSLDTTDVTPPPPANSSSPALTHDPVVVCNWQVQYTHWNGAVMDFGVAKGDVLRYRYLVTDGDLLAYLTRILSAKMREERFKKQSILEDWTFCDEELPGLCRNFLQDSASR